MPTQTATLTLPIRRAGTERCAAQHFGTWAVDPAWFTAAVEGIRSGAMQPQARVPGEDDGPPDVSSVQQGIAVISIDGQMTKAGSSYGGCSTVAVRQAVRSAAADPAVAGIMLVVSSPGGTVAGTQELAADVAAAAAAKTTYAYIEDVGCSAAYWVASQCRTVYANSTAVVGSIGAMVVLQDTTAAQEKVGIKYTVVASGPRKGTMADGRVTDDVVAQVQAIIDAQAQAFFDAVAAGRRDAIPDMDAVTDGAVHVAPKAKALGLIDEVASLDAAMTAILEETKMNTLEEFNAYANAHPEAVKPFQAAGHAAGVTAGAQAERDRFAGLAAAFPERPAFVNEQFAKGHDATKANADFVAVLKAENEQLRQRVAAAPAAVETVPTTGAPSPAAAQPLPTNMAGVDAAATAAAANSPAALAQAGVDQGAAWAKEQRRLRGIRD